MTLARLVAELESAIHRHGPESLIITWDCDDIVLLDSDGTRIALGYMAHPSTAGAVCLTVSAGPGPAGGHPCPDDQHDLRADRLCRMIVGRITQRFAADDTLWHHTTGLVTPDLIDGLVDVLPALHAPHQTLSQLIEATVVLPPPPRVAGNGAFCRVRAATPQRPQTRRPHSPSASAAAVAIETLADALETRLRWQTAGRPPRVAAPGCANDAPDLPLVRNAELRRVRLALYPPPEAEAAPSAPLRLAAHSLDASLIIIALPLGAAMMTYSLLRGGNIRVSARVTAVTATVVGISQSPVAAQVIALM